MIRRVCALVLLLLALACRDALAPVRRWGDLDRDGRITDTDAALVVRHAVGLPIRFDTLPGDVDADARVTTRDALVISTYAATGDAGGSRVGEPMP